MATTWTGDDPTLATLHATHPWLEGPRSKHAQLEAAWRAFVQQYRPPGLCSAEPNELARGAELPNLLEISADEATDWVQGYADAHGLEFRVPRESSKPEARYSS